MTWSRPLLTFAGILCCLSSNASNLEIEIRPQFSGAPLVFDSLTNTNSAGQLISVSRLDFLVSNFALRQKDGVWLSLTNWVSYLSPREKRSSFRLWHIPPGNYNAIRFYVGVTPDLNHSDPAQYPPEHPLNPDVNGLHWGWQGGYVFLAIEGNWLPDKNPKSAVNTTNNTAVSGYSFHIANDPQLTTIELPAALDLTNDLSLKLNLEVAAIFSAKHQIALAPDASSSHSRTNDPLAVKLHENLERAFRVESVAPARLVVEAAAKVRSLVASNATPYRFSFPASFPRPSLPLDNPLTEEGVALGKKLFNEKRLSINNQQSCAGCHELNAAGADPGRAFSIGAEGKPGVRNAMPLFNLAWKGSFFWDGRAPSIRQQVLDPIQNPIEMHETLPNVAAKLLAAGYGPDFARVFGDPGIDSDRVARALEQFLLTQTSNDSKFDRAMAGQAQFTPEEERGFQLFITEYDPRREQFGADCFHCHGGPLFQSQGFANNGLDSDFTDLGRYQVTKRNGDQGRFAVPSLRNIEYTAPYMHDGRFKTLEEVIRHYTTGLHRSATLDPNLAKHPNAGVPLSDPDQKALVAFLKTLTDESLRVNPVPALTQ